MFLAGLLSALGLLFLIFKLGIRRVISYDIAFDVAITGFLIWSFAGTYSGMFAAMIGGLFVSVVLFVMKQTMTREVLQFTTRKLQVSKHIAMPVPTAQWVKVNP